MKFALWRTCQVPFRSSIQERLTGLHRCGFSSPARIFCIDSPERMCFNFTSTTFSPTLTPRLLKSAVASSTHSFFPSLVEKRIVIFSPAGGSGRPASGFASPPPSGFAGASPPRLLK
jgi:hypothetical protein